MDPRIPRGTTFLAEGLNHRFGRTIPLVVCDRGDHFNGLGWRGFDLCVANEEESLMDYANDSYTLVPFDTAVPPDQKSVSARTFSRPPKRLVRRPEYPSPFLADEQISPDSGRITNDIQHMG